jgi:hypothetical protein
LAGAGAAAAGGAIGSEPNVMTVGSIDMGFPSNGT